MKSLLSSEFVARTANPNCPACRQGRFHEGEWRVFHPYAGHGYTKEQGWTHPDLRAAAVSTASPQTPSPLPVAPQAQDHTGPVLEPQSPHPETQSVHPLLRPSLPPAALDCRGRPLEK